MFGDQEVGRCQYSYQEMEDSNIFTTCLLAFSVNFEFEHQQIAQARKPKDVFSGAKHALVTSCSLGRAYQYAPMIYGSILSLNGTRSIGMNEEILNLPEKGLCQARAELVSTNAYNVT